MTVRVKLPEVEFVPTTGGGKTFTKIVAPNTDAPGAPGTPGIPVTNSLVGVPDDATMTVTPESTESITINDVDLYPVQPDPVDAVDPAPDFGKPPFADPPFTQDRDAYNDRGLSPARASGVDLGEARDLDIGGINVPVAQYDPVKNQLKVLTSVVVKVTFKGKKPNAFPEQHPVAVGDRAEAPRQLARQRLGDHQAARPDHLPAVR